MSATMEVYMLGSYADRERQCKANEIIELPDVLAQRYISSGDALPIDPIKRTPIREPQAKPTGKSR